MRIEAELTNAIEQASSTFTPIASERLFERDVLILGNMYRGIYGEELQNKAFSLIREAQQTKANTLFTKLKRIREQS